MKRKSTIKNFGKRLASLRKQKGFTQEQLAKAIGVSSRVIAYYEGETEYAPAHLLVPIAKALKISGDELLGLKDVKQDLNPEYASLWRKLKKVQDLPKRDQKALFHYLNALLEKNKK